MLRIKTAQAWTYMDATREPLKLGFAKAGYLCFLCLDTTFSQADMPLQLNVSCTDYSDYACGPAMARRRSLIWILQYFAAISLFWSLRGDNRPHRSVSSEVPIKPLCWAFVGLMLGVCWAHVGSIVGPCWAQGLCCAHVGPILALGPMASHIGILAYVEPMLSLCWAYVGPS